MAFSFCGCCGAYTDKDQAGIKKYLDSYGWYVYMRSTCPNKLSLGINLIERDEDVSKYLEDKNFQIDKVKTKYSGDLTIINVVKDIRKGTKDDT